MLIRNKALLDEMRATTPRCQWCGTKPPTDMHHLYQRGLGGGSHLDIRINLLALCRVCHGDAHAGVIDRDSLLAVVAAREGVMRQDIKAAKGYVRN